MRGIVARLAASGIEPTQERLAEQASAMTSAWRLGERWCNDAELAADDRERDFVCLAAVQLWSAWLPDMPCDEAFDELIDQGERGLDAEEDAAAAVVWLTAWDGMRMRLRADMTTLAALWPRRSGAGTTCSSGLPA